MSSRARPSWSDRIGEQLPVDNVGQSPFQAAHRFHRGFAGGFLPVVVGASFGGVAQLHDGHDVQGAVDLPVPATRQPVPHVVTGGRVDRGGAGPRREVRAAGEPGDVPDLDQQPGRTGGSDAVQLRERGAGLGEQLFEFFVGGLRALIDPLEIGDQFRGNTRRVLPAVSRGRTFPSSTLACAADRCFFAPPGISSSSSRCSWETILVWSSPSERRRSTSSRNTASCSSLTTGRRPLIRVPTSATECASVSSVLRP